jgi:serpin B
MMTQRFNRDVVSENISREIFMSYLKLFNLAAIAFFLTSCSENTPNSPSEQPLPDIHSSLTRDQNPNATPSELAELVTGNTAFAIDFYHVLPTEPGKNVFFSPYSISLALAMTYAGARNETQRQMARALHFTLDTNKIHKAFNALDLALMQRGNTGQGLRLSIANSMWGQNDLAFKPQFSDIQKVNYGADIHLVDFLGATEDSRLAINSWVSDKTMQKINDLIQKGDITSLTHLVLVNAIYFNGLWQQAFDKSRTTDAPFHLSGTKSVKVPMMARKDTFAYAAGENYQAIELPFRGKELSLVIMLPAANALDSFEQALSPQSIQAILGSLRTQEVDLMLPRLQLTTPSIDVADAFKALGMVAPFNSADFSGITEEEDLYIAKILHKAALTLNEEGAQAAAATAVILDIKSMGTTMIVDRPFLLLIRDKPTGTILFMGKICDPSSVN